jgi:sulfate transport system ATP-binding protein
VRLASPEHAQAQDAKAFAYVRPHDLDVRRYVAGEEGNVNAYAQARGIAAKLVRAIVVGPIARLELEPHGGQSSGAKDILEAHLGAQEYKALGLKEGDDEVATPRKARVFVQQDPALSI